MFYSVMRRIGSKAFFIILIAVDHAYCVANISVSLSAADPHRKSLVLEDKDELDKEMDLAKTVQLKYALQDDILSTWPYKDYISDPGDLLVDQGLIDRAQIYLGSSQRLSNLFKRAVEGKSVTTAFIGSSVSRLFTNDASSRKWIYPNSLRLWWNKVVLPITGSRMYLRDTSAAGLDSDYFSRCLKSHVPDKLNIHLILWELSGSDYKKSGTLRPIDAQPLEKLLRNALEYRSHPDVVMLNMFKGNQDNGLTYCKELDERGEKILAQHYNCSLLSWSKSICPYLENDKDGLAYSYLFARDHLHPSIVGHAQMSFILIDFLRDKFLKFLEEPKLEARSLPLARPLYIAAEAKSPLCFTTIQTAAGSPAENDLPVIFINSDDYADAITRSRIIKGRSAKPLRLYRLPPIVMTFRVPIRKRYSALGVLPDFAEPLKTVARIDNFPFVALDTSSEAIGKIQSIPASNLRPGTHVLRVWSLDKRLRIVAVTLE